MNILYIVPNVLNAFGGPNTRTKRLKKEFLKDGGEIIETKQKFFRSFKLRKINLAYVESATNRINLIDIPCLFFLRLRSKKQSSLSAISI